MDKLRFLLRLGSFAVFAVVFYVLLLSLVPERFSYRTLQNLKVPYGGNGHSYTRLKEARGHAPVDILFVGSSHAYRGFDPRLFQAQGVSAFNLGSSSQTPIQTEVLLIDYLDHLKPRLLIYELDPLAFTFDGVESSLDLMANGNMGASAWWMAWHIGHLNTWNTLLYTQTRELLHGPAAVNETKVKEKDLYITGGFVQRELETNRSDVAYDTCSWIPLSFQVAAFMRTMDLLTKRKIPVVIVEAPVTTRKYVAYGERTRYENMLRQQAPFLNMNGAVILDDSLHFYDSHHLNQRGVEIVNTALIARLKTEGYFPVP